MHHNYTFDSLNKIKYQYCILVYVGLSIQYIASFTTATQFAS